MTYPLLEKAPPHDTPEFIDFLRENNPVVFESLHWIVIENCKYHTKEIPWYTAFHKPRMVADKRGIGYTDWYEDISALWYEFGDYRWIKKAPKEQTVKRFHIHLVKEDDKKSSILLALLKDTFHIHVWKRVYTQDPYYFVRCVKCQKVKTIMHT